MTILDYLIQNPEVALIAICLIAIVVIAIRGGLDGGADGD